MKPRRNKTGDEGLRGPPNGSGRGRTAELHPHLDVIESALKKFEDVRNGGRNGLSEDEKEIAEQADREMHRLYQEKRGK